MEESKKARKIAENYSDFFKELGCNRLFHYIKGKSYFEYSYKKNKEVRKRLEKMMIKDMANAISTYVEYDFILDTSFFKNIFSVVKEGFPQTIKKLLILNTCLVLDLQKPQSDGKLARMSDFILAFKSQNAKPPELRNNHSSITVEFITIQRGEYYYHFLEKPLPHYLLFYEELFVEKDCEAIVCIIDLGPRRQIMGRKELIKFSHFNISPDGFFSDLNILNVEQHVKTLIE